MRQIYTSPRHENVDRVIALMAEHGIDATVSNRSNYNRANWKRFSYAQRSDNRGSWPQVWITHADDYARARQLLIDIGIDPVIRFSEELAAERNPTPAMRRQRTASRVRHVLLVLVLVVFGLISLRYMYGF